MTRKNPEGTPAEQPPRKRRRWKRILIRTAIGFAVFLLAAALAGPPIAASVAKGMIQDSFSENLNGTLEIDSLTISLGGTVSLGGIKITPSGAEPLVEIPSAVIEVDPWSAIGGTFEGKAVIRNPTIHLRRTQDGSTNLHTLLAAATKAGKDDGRSESKKSESPSPALPLKFDFQLEGGTIQFHDDPRGRSSEISNLAITASIPSLDQESTGKLKAQIGSSGTLDLAGRFTITSRQGTAQWSLSVAALDDLLGAVGIFTEIETLRGKIEASGTISYGGWPRVSVESRSAVSDLHLAGPAIGREPVSLAAASLTHSISLDSSGNGPFQIRISSGPAVDLEIEGTARGIVSDRRSVEAAATLKSELRPLTNSLAPILRLMEGYRLEGTLSADAKVKVSTSGGSLNLAEVDARVHSGSVIVVEPGGSKHKLSDAVSIETVGVFEGASGRLELAKLEASGLPVRISGKGGFRGLTGSTQPTVEPSDMRISADLSALYSELKSFLDLGDLSFGGRLQVSLHVAGNKDVADIVLDGQGSGLTLSGISGRSMGPLDAAVGIRATADLRDGAQSRIERISLTSDPASVSFAGTADSLAFDKRSVNLQWSLELNPDHLQRHFASWWEPAKIQGAKLNLSGTVAGGLSGFEVAARTVVERLGIQTGGSPRFVENLPLNARIKGKQRGGTIELDSVVLASEGLSVDARGSFGSEMSATAAIRMDPDKISRFVSAFADGLETSGRPAELRFSLSRASPFAVRGSFQCPQITLKGGPLGSATASQKEISMEWDVTFADDIGVRMLRARAAGLDLTGTGSLAGGLALRGKVDPTPFAPLISAFGQGIEVAGSPIEMDMTVRYGNLLSASGVVRCSEFTARKGPLGDKSVRQKDLLIRVTAAEMDLSRIESLKLKDLHVRSDMLALDGSGDLAEGSTLALRGTIYPDKLAPVLVAFGGGLEVSGKPIEIAVQAVRGKMLDVRITARGERISATRGPLGLNTLLQQNIDLRVEASRPSDGETLILRDLRFASDAGTVTVRGTVRSLGSNPSFELELATTGRLDLLVAQVGPLVGLPAEYAARGTLVSKGTLRGSADAVRVDEKMTITDFEFAGPTIQTVREKKLDLYVDGLMDLSQRRASFRKVGIGSSFLNGTLQGEVSDYDTSPLLTNIELNFRYVPDTLGALLAPWIPMKLLGKQERNVQATVNGRLKDMDVNALLQSGTANVQFDIGQLVGEGFGIDGTVKGKLQDGKVILDGPFTVNEGKLHVAGDYDARSDSNVGSFRIFGEGVRLNVQSAPLLRVIHPMFNQVAGTLDGRVGFDLSGRWEGALGGGMEAVNRCLKVEGNIFIDEFVIVGSPFVADLVQQLGEEGDRVPGYLKIPDLTIEDGRVRYEQMELKIQNTVLRFRGGASIDPEGPLHIKMYVPIGRKFIKRNRSLEPFLGEELEVTIKGTTASPVVDWAGAIEKMLKKGIGRAIEDALQDGLEDIFKKKKKK